jgi:hypothetical protein
MPAIRTIAMVLTVLMAVEACGPDPSKYTVAYYKEHRDERKAKLAQCTDDPGRLRDDPLCINAHQADFKESVGDLRTLPPIGLEQAAEDLKREQRERLREAQTK